MMKEILIIPILVVVLIAAIVGAGCVGASGTVSSAVLQGSAIEVIPTPTESPPVIVLTPQEATIGEGETVLLDLVGLPPGVPSNEILWSFSPKDIVGIKKSDRKKTLLKGIGQGTTTVSVYVPEYGTYTAEITVVEV
jgi:hypothetical protein